MRAAAGYKSNMCIFYAYQPGWKLGECKFIYYSDYQYIPSGCNLERLAKNEKPSCLYWYLR